jgi:hypothetical protein
MGFATFASGPLFKSYAGGAYFAMSLIAVSAMMAAVYIRARWNQGTL